MIHAVVVLVPLLVLAGIVYALVPRLRGRTGWVAVLLALAGVGSTLLAKLSGDAFRRRIVRKHMANQEILVKIDSHRSLGTTTLYLTIALAVVVLLLVVLLRTLPRGASMALSVITVVLGLVTVYYVYRTGDAGARIVWTGY